MSDVLYGALRRKAAAVLAAPLLFGSVSAATPLNRADADVLYYSEQFFSDATYSVKVGAGNAYCDGDYIWHWGYATAYSTIVYRNECP